MGYRTVLETEELALSIAFIDLQAQRQRIADRIDSAVLRTIEAGAYIMGPEVAQFEKQLAAFAGAARTISCANGTDALVLPLMAWGIGEGDAVFCPSFTFAATAEIIPWTGASAVFVDILPDTYNMDPDDLEMRIQSVLKQGKLKPRAIIAVDLFGQPADYVRISEIARRYGLKLIADSAQGFGCTLDGKHPVQWADCSTTSFFPAKPLGCYGDGGAIQTNDPELAELLDSLRVHGKATKQDIAREKFEHDPKYMNVRIGLNSRLDTIQAAILIEKLAIFADEIERRNAVASRYEAGLRNVVKSVPSVISGGVSTWAQYTIESSDRDGLAAHLKAHGVPTAVYYPIPIHRQKIYSVYCQEGDQLPVSDAKASQVLSLPMHPYLEPSVQDEIIRKVRAFNGARA
jgi:UDP-2-acetamido-2-deoxy-ribo-hexuluronate aminotransferase